MGIVFVCLVIVGVICIVDANTIICWFKNNRALVHIIGASILTKEVNENKYYVCFGLEDGRIKRLLVDYYVYLSLTEGEKGIFKAYSQNFSFFVVICL